MAGGVTLESSSISGPTAGLDVGSNEEKGMGPIQQHQEQQQQHKNEATEEHTESSAAYSVFTPRMRRYIGFAASWAALFSPLSSNIYFPVLNTLANELSVSDSTINLTLTSYMVFQGLAPMFLGDFADTTGRRPAFILCFVIFIAANVGLALQSNYAALLVLRCMQSAGSSATVAIASGVVADVATTAERGFYMGLVLAGALLGPSVGPVIGGILGHYLGWRSIFWFLTIFAAAFVVQFVIFFPETARRIVGDGSIRPSRICMSVMSYLEWRKQPCVPEHDDETPTPTRAKLRFPNPFRAIAIVFQKETALVLFAIGIIYAGFFTVAAPMPALYHRLYGFNDFQIGLCYLPYGVGAAFASIANGYLLDYNYRRIAKGLGITVVRNRQQDIGEFPIEKARIQVALPLLLVGCCCMIAYGWVLHLEVSVAVPLVILFCSGITQTGAFNAAGTLIVDLNSKSAATAMASSNLVRCLIGAGAIAAIGPMVERLGPGWCYTLAAFIMACTCPIFLVLVSFGLKWRADAMQSCAEQQQAANSS